MRIFIITMDDPVYTLPFIREIIERRTSDIIGVATARGNRMTIGKKRSPLAYLIALLLIMGIVPFLRYAFITIHFRLRQKLSKWLPFISDPGILAFAQKKGIPVFEMVKVNSGEFLDTLRQLKPDVIIHQSQAFLKQPLLSIPAKGVLNRHNALLPKNRGRLTPFWVLLRDEKETGVSIHFVTEQIDAGDIVVQERFVVDEKETFHSLVQKNYKVAPVAMLRALERLESGNFTTIPNPDALATYNPVPTIRDAWNYRRKRIFQ